MSLTAVETTRFSCFPSYKSDPQIKAMTDLVDAYQRREVHLAEKILRGMSLRIEPLSLI